MRILGWAKKKIKNDLLANTGAVSNIGGGAGKPMDREANAHNYGWMDKISLLSSFFLKERRTSTTEWNGTLFKGPIEGNF